jgi:ketosteroid isomerase-like protein
MGSEHAGVLPWAGRRRGCDQAAGYLRQFAAVSRWHPIEDVVFTAAGDRVMVDRRNRNTARATGRPCEHQWVIVSTIRGGKIATRFRHYHDPAGITHALG